MRVGATYLGNNHCQFTVWAPLLQKVAVKIIAPEKRLIPMQPCRRGYWQTTINYIVPGTLYLYQLEENTTRPDPASYFQPQGVHTPSQVVELAEKVTEFSQQQGHKFYLIAESDLNDVRVINPPELGGYGIDAQWSDNFHHSLHTLLTGEQQGYYQDFGRCEHLAKALRESFVYSGQYSPYRQRYHGSFAGDRPSSQYIHNFGNFSTIQEGKDQKNTTRNSLVNDPTTWWQADEIVEVNDPKLGKLKISQGKNLHFRSLASHDMSLMRVERLNPKSSGKKPRSLWLVWVGEQFLFFFV